jgi:hypothetical protein
MSTKVKYASIAFAIICLDDIKYCRWHIETCKETPVKTCQISFLWLGGLDE